MLAADVKHSYDTLIGPYAAPGYRTMLVDVAGCDVVDDRTVRFRFNKPNRELPLIVGGMPVFSRDWGVVNGKAKRFDEIVTDIPIGSGPVQDRPGALRQGHHLRARPELLGARPAGAQGQRNFDRITIKIYKDNTARLEALKAGEFDMMTFYLRRRLGAPGERQASSTRGELVKRAFQHKQPGRLPGLRAQPAPAQFQDPRVRKALGLALDFEWMNRQLFYGRYKRVDGLLRQHRLPGRRACRRRTNWSCWSPCAARCPPAVFGPMYTPPTTEAAGHSLRDNLRQAQALLQGGGLGVPRRRAAQCQGRAAACSNTSTARKARVAYRHRAWMRALEKLGIELQLRVGRLRAAAEAPGRIRVRHDHHRLPGHAFNPGSRWRTLFGSKAADDRGLGQLHGREESGGRRADRRRRWRAKSKARDCSPPAARSTA